MQERNLTHELIRQFPFLQQTVIEVLVPNADIPVLIINDSKAMPIARREQRNLAQHLATLAQENKIADDELTKIAKFLEQIHQAAQATMNSQLFQLFANKLSTFTAATFIEFYSEARWQLRKTILLLERDLRNAPDADAAQCLLLLQNLFAKNEDIFINQVLDNLQKTTTTKAKVDNPKKKFTAAEYAKSFCEELSYAKHLQNACKAFKLPDAIASLCDKLCIKHVARIFSSPERGFKRKEQLLKMQAQLMKMNTEVFALLPLLKDIFQLRDKHTTARAGRKKQVSKQGKIYLTEIEHFAMVILESQFKNGQLNFYGAQCILIDKLKEVAGKIKKDHEGFFSSEKDLRVLIDATVAKQRAQVERVDIFDSSSAGPIIRK